MELFAFIRPAIHTNYRLCYLGTYLPRSTASCSSTRT